jgi:hypothetical protein
LIVGWPDLLDGRVSPEKLLCSLAGGPACSQVGFLMGQ